MDFEFTDVESLDKVPQDFRSLYHSEPNEEGKYSVGDDFKPVAAAIMGFNRNLKDMRKGLKDKQIDLTPLADFGDTPASIKEAFELKLAQLEETYKSSANKDVAKQIENVKAAMAEAHGKELTKRDIRSEALQKQLYTILVENTATSAILEAKGLPNLLMPFIKEQTKVAEEDGKLKVFIVDRNGETRYGHTGSPMTLKELVDEMKAAEMYGRLFESEERGGGGTPPGPTRRPSGDKSRALSANEKIAMGLSKGQYGRRGGR